MSSYFIPAMLAAFGVSVVTNILLFVALRDAMRQLDAAMRGLHAVRRTLDPGAANDTFRGQA